MLGGAVIIRSLTNGPIIWQPTVEYDTDFIKIQIALTPSKSQGHISQSFDLQKQLIIIKISRSINIAHVSKDQTRKALSMQTFRNIGNCSDKFWAPIITLI